MQTCGELPRLVHYKLAVEDKQLLQRDRGDTPRRACDIRLGEIKKPQQTIEVVTADLGVERASTIIQRIKLHGSIEGVNIGKDVTVGAGAVVVEDLSDGIVAFGVPAHPVSRERS